MIRIEPTIAGCAALVAAREGLSIEMLLGVRRYAVVVGARHLAMWLAHEAIGAPIAEIGRTLGFDPKTVSWAIINVNELRIDDAVYAAKLRDLLAAFEREASW